MTLNNLLQEKKVILHFTHEADADGIGCEALMKCLTEVIQEKITSIRCGYGNFLQKVTEQIDHVKNIYDLNHIGIVITDLGIEKPVLDLLESSKIPYCWIDHHQVKTKYDDALYGWFFIFNGVYDISHYESILANDVFNPENYRGKMKYSATALLYFQLLSHGFLDFPRTGSQRQFELFVINSLSDSDTFAFKNRTTPASYWSPSDLIANEEDDSITPLNMKYVVDPWPLLMKNEGADSVLRAFTSIYGDRYRKFDMDRHINDLLLTPTNRYHNNRVTMYEQWKRTIVRADFCFLKEEPYFAFTPTKENDFSIFSDWYLTSHPEVAGTMALFPDSRILSFRSLEGSDMNVAELATKWFDGGGHVHVSGATASIRFALDVLSNYWQVRMIEKEQEPKIVLQADTNDELYSSINFTSKH